MKQITVPLGERAYRIAVTNTFQTLPRQLAGLRLPSRHGWIISHPELLRRYGAQLAGPLRRAGWTLQTLTVPPSETSKSLATAQRVIGQIARASTMRVPVLFALGGGVVGDLTGFVASAYRRGVPYVQVPTTLLAQVDSAIGGKVGVDLPEGKNLVGQFYHPRLVWNHLGLLSSLPARQRRSGLGEVIKYGVIADAPLFGYLETHIKACLAMAPQAVRVMVERSCRIKARVVGKDERETGTLRAQLNFGHTLGHALEAATAYRRFTHGEAIAIGMCAAAELSVDLGFAKREAFERILGLIQAAGLPTVSRGVALGRVRKALRYDKKFIHGRPRWVILKRLGRVAVSEAVPEEAVLRVLKRYVRS